MSYEKRFSAELSSARQKIRTALINTESADPFEAIRFCDLLINELVVTRTRLLTADVNLGK